MLPSQHARWSEDVSGSPVSSPTSVFAPMSDRLRRPMAGPMPQAPNPVSTPMTSPQGGGLTPPFRLPSAPMGGMRRPMMV